MIDVRIRFEIGDAIYWSSPIRNEAALAALRVALRERRATWEECFDVAHAYEADACLAIAESMGSGPTELRWGPAGRQIFRCEIARVPTAAGMLAIPAHVVAPEPRDLTGPSADEVAQHTPAPREGKDGDLCGD